MLVQKHRFFMKVHRLHGNLSTPWKFMESMEVYRGVQGAREPRSIDFRLIFGRRSMDAASVPYPDTFRMAPYGGMGVRYPHPISGRVMASSAR